MKIFDLLLVFNILSFLFFGISCLFTEKMKLEFTRFGLTNNQRILTGILQIMAVVGLILGFFDYLIGLVATIGLSLQMLAGFIVRLKIKDSLYRSYPALAFMVINMILAFKFYKLLF